MKDKIAKVIGELTPINVKFVGKKKITCEIKESELVKRLTQLFKSELDEQREEIKEKIKQEKHKITVSIRKLDEYDRGNRTRLYWRLFNRRKGMNDILKELNK